MIPILSRWLSLLAIQLGSDELFADEHEAEWAA